MVSVPARRDQVLYAHKRGLALKAFVWGEPEPGLAGKLKREVKIQDGIEQEKAKSIVKLIKESGLKVQASIQGDEVRVNGKQIDDLQSVMRMLEASNLDLPLQFANLKR